MSSMSVVDECQQHHSFKFLSVHGLAMSHKPGANRLKILTGSMLMADSHSQPSKDGIVSTIGFRMEAPKLLVLPGDQPCTGSGCSIVSLNGISNVNDSVLNRMRAYVEVCLIGFINGVAMLTLEVWAGSLEGLHKNFLQLG